MNNLDAIKAYKPWYEYLKANHNYLIDLELVTLAALFECEKEEVRAELEALDAASEIDQELESRCFVHALNWMKANEFDVKDTFPEEGLAVAMKDETLHFVYVSVNREAFEDKDITRSEFEDRAALWILRNCVSSNCAVVCDFLAMNVIKDDGALLRFHQNAFA